MRSMISFVEWTRLLDNCPLRVTKITLSYWCGATLHGIRNGMPHFVDLVPQKPEWPLLGPPQKPNMTIMSCTACFVEYYEILEWPQIGTTARIHMESRRQRFAAFAARECCECP